MSLLFVASACAGGLYFGLAQRRFDFLAVGFLSAVVYFLPGFLGITLYPLGGSHLAPLELSEGTYLAMALVLLTILATALAFDALVPPDRRPGVHLHKAEWLPEVATILAAAGFGWTVLSSGSSLLDSNKAVMMASLGPAYTLWEVGAEVGLISSFVLRRRWCLAICGLLLIGTLGIGFRYPLVLGLIACGTIWLNRMPPMRFLVRCWALVPLLALGGTFFCVYKQVQWNLKAGYLERVYEALIDPDTYLMSIVKSEPFITQTILNEVLERDYRLDPTYLLGNAFQLLPGTQMFGGTVVSFNDQFQPALFPHVEYGMAGNLWAEGYAIGGWAGVVGFALLISIGLGGSSFWMRSKDCTLLVLASLMAVVIAFYVHRNEVAMLITLEKRAALLVFAAYVMALGAAVSGRVKEATAG